MKSPGTFYEALGVREDATAGDIKVAFRRLALAHHPDRNTGDLHSEARFKVINEAYGVLGDDAKRAAYDEELVAARGARAAERTADQTPSRATRSGRSPTRPIRAYPSPPTPTDSWDAIFVTILGVGIAAAVATDGESEQWDSRAGRYRGADGRFSSG